MGTDDRPRAFVPDGFAVPRELVTEEFAQRSGFTYTVLEGGSGRVIGCVYIYPSKGADGAADVRSWVRADRADLDVALHDAVAAWLEDAWPFTAVSYAPRTGG